MLRWRIPLGALLIIVLVGLCWLDHSANIPGVWLVPVALLLAVMAGAEVVYLSAAGRMRPLSWVIHVSNVLIVASAWIPVAWLGYESRYNIGGLGWPMLALTLGVMLAFLGEMARYKKPGGATANLAMAIFGMVYVGVMLAFVVQLRLVFGVAALASLVIVVKLGDIGAYAAGSLFGRHKMATILSPGKTIEGAAGAVLFATIGAWATFKWLVPWLAVTSPSDATGSCYGWLIFGLLVAIAGIFGDLAESLIKRDFGCKDSSRWIPGFGGVMDILDSVLLAAPVAYLCWSLLLAGN